VLVTVLPRFCSLCLRLTERFYDAVSMKGKSKVRPKQMVRVLCVAAAVAFLIAGSGTASAVVEEFGPPTTEFPDDGVAQGPGLFRDGDRRDLTSPSGGGNIMSSVGSDNGPDDQGGGGPLPTQFDELNADYSSFTLDGLFPVFLTGSESVDSQIMNGDSDHLGDFFVNPFGSSPLGLSIFHPLEDRPGKGGSHCSSDGSQSGVQCELEGDPSSLIAGSTGAGSDAGDEPPQQIPNFSSPNAPIGENDLSSKMTTAQNSFVMAWQWDVTHGIFPPACCAFDVTPPVVDGVPDVTSDVVSPPSDFAPIPPGVTSGNSDGTVSPPPSVPEIPAPAMLLIGFGGLALVGWRRLRGSGAAGSALRTR
jgi:hypothetical protein